MALLAKPDNLVFIASVESEPVGYAHGEVVHRAEAPFHYAYDEFRLHAISAQPAWHRRGVGEALMERSAKRQEQGA